VVRPSCWFYTTKHLHWLPVSGRDCRRMLQSRQTTTTFVSYWSTLIIQTVARSEVIYVRPTINKSLHRQTLLLVGSHAAPPPSGTIIHHLYAPLTVSLVLGLTSRLYVHKTFVAGPLYMPLTPLPSLSRVIIRYFLIYLTLHRCVNKCRLTA